MICLLLWVLCARSNIPIVITETGDHITAFVFIITKFIIHYKISAKLAVLHRWAVIWLVSRDMRQKHPLTGGVLAEDTPQSAGPTMYFR